jgi:monoamine oxidase
MPRTPLLRELGQLAQDHRDADRFGVTPIEARNTRRQFLKRAGVIGAAAAVGPSLLARPARAATGTRIAIVGGGIAGLNAALTLAGKGIASTVFESSGRLGGRMHSDSPLVVGGDNYFQGQTAEYCGELIDSNHNTIQTLAKRFGLTLADVLQAEPNGSTETYYFLGGYYPYSQASADFQPVHNTLQGQIQAAPFPTVYNSYTPTGYNLDQMSLYQWIEQYVPGGHGSDFGRLLDSAYNQEYGSDTTDQSALNVVYLLGYKAKPGNFQIYGASDERYHIAGGNQQLPEAIGSYLTGTGLTKITMNTAMTKVAKNSDGTVSLYFNGSKTRQVFVTRAQPGSTGILVEYTGGSVAGAYKPSTPYSNASNNPQVTTYAKSFLSQLETVFPGITPHWNSKAILSTPFLDPNFYCSYSYWRVGQYTQFSGYEKVAQGPIHFAGEHCSINFQGYMEGGAAEGARAANEIIALLS